MGIKILSEEEINEYTEYAYRDYSQEIKHKDELVAMDVGSSTIYIAQNILEYTGYADLQGELTIESADCQLYFGADDKYSFPRTT